jgi:hypothetical protein
MILSSVRLDQPKFRNRWIDESPINEWLLASVGAHAPTMDTVSESRPWRVEHNFGYLVYHFAKEEDAVMFALRWS